MDAGGEEGAPGSEAERAVEGEPLAARAAEGRGAEDGEEACAEGREGDVAAVKEGDDDDGAEVVDDGEGREEDDEAERRVAGCEREDAEREGDVGRHGDAPAAGGRRAEVDEGVEERGHEHAAEGRADGQEHGGFRA